MPLAVACLPLEFATSIAKWPTPVAAPADFRLGPGQLHFNPIREQVGTSARADFNFAPPNRK